MPNDGLIRYLGLLNAERLLITSPKALSEVLVTRNYDFEKPSQMRATIGRMLGVGILLAEGEQHKIQRRNLMPAFAFRHVKDLYPVFWNKSRETVLAMGKAIQAGVTDEVQQVEATGRQGSAIIEVGAWASRATLDIIGIAGLGRDFGATQDPTNKLSETYNVVFRPSGGARILGILSLFTPAWILHRIPMQRNSDISSAAATIRSVCRDLVQEKKEKLARKELTDLDILSVALESGGFRDEELVDQMMTFLAAGHETTASAMTWAIYMLARHPEVQARLRAEVRGNLPSMASASDVSSLDIDRLPYLNAVCNEVLRYYPPVPMTMRETARDTSILGQYVPKGTRIILCPWSVNQDKALWGPDADAFNPDRWLARDEGDKTAASGGAASNYSFLTFLHGPRSCIGQSFAKAEFACLLAAWVGRFDFRLRNEEEMDEKNVLIKGGITARPANGMYVYATEVEGW